MKKYIAFLLALVLSLSLWGCGDSGTDSGNTMEGLNIGYGRADITPDFNVGLGGYSDNETRISSGILDFLYATCIAFTEGDKTILLITVDNLAINSSALNGAREAIPAATGVPAENIYLSATHTHSAPSLNGSNAETTKYKELLQSGLLQAAQDALADRSPATVAACTTEVPGMNFTRHYLLEDGSYAGPSFGNFNAAPIKEHVTETDPRMVLVKFDRIDESKQDIVLMNWQAHPANASTNGYNNISADFVGSVRNKFERATNMHFAYFTGASGNQVCESKIVAEKHFLTPKQYGEKLAEHAVSVLPQLTATESTGIKTTQYSFTAEVDHSWDNMIDIANEVPDKLK